MGRRSKFHSLCLPCARGGGVVTCQVLDNPSVTAAPCQLPLHKGALGSANKKDILLSAHKGEQAKILNRITKELFSGKTEDVNTGLKELVGHTPFQVLIGAIVGIITALAYGWIIGVL